MYCRSNFFFVASNEGCIMMSCATSLALGLIKPHDRLNHLPPEGNVIYIYITDESWLKVHMLVRKTKLKSSNEEAPIVCSIQEQSFTKCSKKKQDKNCQANKITHVWPVKPAKDMWSNRPAVKIQNKMSKIVPQEGDKNCQINMKSVCSDKKCHGTHMWPVQPAMKNNDMQSVTSSNDMKSIEQSSSKLKNTQDTKIYVWWQ